MSAQSRYQNTEIDCVDLTRSIIILGDGTHVPIATWLDKYGDQIEDPRDAVSCVGQLPDGNWLCCQVLPGDRKFVRTN